MCNPEIHHRRSIRLKGHDYSLDGAYFVTICVKDKKCILGDIKDHNLILSSIGKIVYQCWTEVPGHFNFVKLDVFIVMPNHFHGIVFITNDGTDVQSNDDCRGVQLNAPTDVKLNTPTNFYKSISPKQKTLSVIIRTFKAAVTTQCRRGVQSNEGVQLNAPTIFQWQRNYYEHIIRNDDELNRIREYIINNPLQWELDRENPNYRGVQLNAPTYHNQWIRFEERIYGKTK